MKSATSCKTFVTLALALLALCLSSLAGAQTNTPAFEGKYVATDYNYGGAGPNAPNALIIDSGGSGVGSQTYTIRTNGFISLPRLGGRLFMPLATNAPIVIDTETVTPSAVSCSTPAVPGTCFVTATVASAHGAGSRISSATFGLQEAINDAFQSGGGSVIVDSYWVRLGGTTALMRAATPYGIVSIMDRRTGAGIPWTATQTTATVLAAPATLTATTVGFGLNGANTTGGTYNGASTYHYCVAYVDITGNEGPCSADFSAATAGTGTANQIGFAAPAASTGAVGYTVYISLAGGTYNLTYQAPLVDGTTCTLTKIETVTPACAVTNATYGQTGSNAKISALTVNTAPLHLLATTASTTSAYIGTPSGRTTYAYAPHNTGGTFGFVTSQQAYAIAPATATTVPAVIATIPIPIGFMNQVGTTIKICGQADEAANGSTATVQHFQFLWDAAGSNTAGAPVIVGDLELTATLVTANADHWTFCWSGQTTVSGAGVTAGSIQPVGGQLVSTYGAGVLGNAGGDINVAAVGSLNLAGTGGNTQRIHVVWLHTTGTDANGVTLRGLTVEVL